MKDITRYALRAKNFVEKNRKFHLQVQETLKKSQEEYNVMHDQHIIEKSVSVGDRVWLQLNKEMPQESSKKIKALQYGPFEILENVGDNSNRLNLPLYMCIYSMMNAENIKLYENSMLDREEEQVLLSIEDLPPYAQEKLIENTIFQKRSRTTRQRKHDLWKIGLKGQLPRQDKQYSREKVEENFPLLIQAIFWGPKVSYNGEI